MKKTGKEYIVEAVPDNLDRVLGFVESEAKQAGCPKKTVGQIAVAIEELYVNIASYAYAPGTGNCSVSFWSGVQKDGGSDVHVTVGKDVPSFA